MKSTCVTLASALLWLVSAGPVASAEPPPEPAARPLVVAIDYAFPPHQWIDEEGEARGFDVDLFRSVADEIGLAYEIRGGPWDQVRGQLERGEVDLTPGMVRTAERAQLLDFSASTFSEAHTIFVRQDSSIASLDDLAGVVVAVGRRTFVDDLLPLRVPSARPLRAKTSLEALRYLADEKAGAAILLQTQGLYLVREHGLTGIRSIGKPVSNVRFRFAVPEGREALLVQLNDGLLELTVSGVHDALHDSWFGVLQPRGILDSRAGRLLLAASGLIAALLLAATLWSRMLRSRVAARTGELQASEAQKRQLERQLLQVQKMEALGRLAGGVAHDFDNVLTTIIGNASLALATKDIDGPVARALNAIRRAGQAGANLTGQLLAFSRGDSAEPCNVSWGKVTDDAREMLLGLVDSRVAMRFDIPADLWPVRLDPGQALQIVMNLAINARDAIQGLGNVQVEAENTRREDRDFVRLTVRDDGEGMNAETCERVFEPFFSTKASGKGTGLGLSTVHGIVERCGGRVVVESEPGVGSSFHVLLPRAPELEPSEARPPTAAEGEGGTILLVEDHEGVRELAGVLLRTMGHDVVEAADGESALVVLREKRGITLLVTDLQLPGMSGMDLAKRVLEESPDMGVIFLSGYSGPLELPGGAWVRFVPKPFTRESLAEAVGSLHEGRRAHTTA